MTSSTWHYEVDRGSRIPEEAHRVAKHLLMLGLLDTKVLALMFPVANQGVDVARQPQQLAFLVFQLELQKVAAALDAVRTLHHIHHTYQCEPAAGAEIRISVSG